MDLILDFSELRLSSETTVTKENGEWVEHVRGQYIPHRVRFVDAKIKVLIGEFTHLSQIPTDHPARILLGMLTWRLTGEKHPSYRLFNGSADADLWFSARACLAETRDDLPRPADFVRTHSPAPPLKPGVVPRYPALNRRYGGDPVTFHLDNQTFHQRLFVGSLDVQPENRPEVDAILNLGEASSKWLEPDQSPIFLNDRWVEMGEGTAGMSVAALKVEAQWVIARLRKNQRVLIHCVAGFNRSVTICVAVLMLLEGLTPEAALARVREHHAWAKPDPVHWLRLKGLANLSK